MYLWRHRIDRRMVVMKKRENKKENDDEEAQPLLSWCMQKERKKERGQ